MFLRQFEALTIVNNCLSNTRLSSSLCQICILYYL